MINGLNLYAEIFNEKRLISCYIFTHFARHDSDVYLNSIQLPFVTILDLGSMNNYILHWLSILYTLRRLFINDIVELTVNRLDEFDNRR
jgi:hypothetical protein